MEIKNLSEDLIETIFYETIEGNGKVVQAQLPIQVGEIIGLPEYLDGIIVTSDLQGLVQMDDEKILLGEATAALLPLLLEIEFNLDAKKIGVFLCGDFFATLDRRGGVGDVRNVWDAFNKNFRWVTGVAGNHDMFGNEEEFKVFKDKQGIHYLNKEENKIENIRIAGLSGIIGKPDRVNRVKEEDYFQKLKMSYRYSLIDGECELVVGYCNKINGLADCLNGGFGITPPFKVIWENSSVAVKHLDEMEWRRVRLDSIEICKKELDSEAAKYYEEYDGDFNIFHGIIDMLLGYGIEVVLMP